MANSEIDSFVRKFKTLCQAGRNASLTLSSNAGKAVMNLRLDLGVLIDNKMIALLNVPHIKPEIDLHNSEEGRDELLLVSLLLNKQRPVYLLKKKMS